VAGGRIDAIVVVMIVLTIFAPLSWMSGSQSSPVDTVKDPLNATVGMRPKLRRKGDRSLYLVICSSATKEEVQWMNDEAG
jgi:hypothetical protein